MGPWPDGDPLDQIFWQHDYEYGEIAGNGSLDNPTEEQKKLLAKADSKAITSMIDIGYENGTDMQAYAGATILAFLLQIYDSYDESYPYGVEGVSIVHAGLFGVDALSLGLYSVVGSGYDDVERKKEFVNFAIYQTASFINNQDDNISYLELIVATKIFDTVWPIFRAFATGFVIVDTARQIIGVVKDIGPAAIKFAVLGTVKGAIAIGATVNDIYTIGKEIITEGLISTYDFIVSAVSAIKGTAESALSQAKMIIELGQEFIKAGYLTVGEFFGIAGQDVAEDGYELLYGTDADDEVYLSQANQIYYGFGGDDIIHSGNGDDYIYAGSGNDVVYGEGGSDHIYGGEGNDNIYGGDGDDLLFGEEGDDLLKGERGNDILYGGPGNDLLYGDEGDDFLKGEQGNDILYGGTGNDTLYGDEGDDILYGESGNDTLYGGPGNDILNGGKGADALIGEGGTDTFVFDADALIDARNGVYDTIIDYEIVGSSTGSTDIIDLTAVTDYLNHVIPGTNISEVVRARQDQGGAYSALEIRDSNDVWLPIAKLAGVHEGDKVRLLLDPTDGSGAPYEIIVSGIGDYGVIYNYIKSYYREIIGTNGNDYIELDPWYDRHDIDGRGGVDTAIFFEDRAQFDFVTLSGVTRLLSKGGYYGNGEIFLTNVEYLQFQDITINLVSEKLDHSGNTKSDILWRNKVSGEIVIWQMDGINPYTTQSLGKPATAWQVVNTDADYNADAKADLLWRNSNTGEVLLWEMDGVDGKSAKSFGKVSTAWQIVDSDADYNGDGKADLLWRNAGTGEVLLWQMDGVVDGKTAKSFGKVSTAWQIVDSSSDFNGDSKADLLWRNTGTGEVLLWQMDGVDGKSAKSFGKVSTAWQIVDSSSDFNGDSKADLLWRNAGTGEVLLWQMDGVNGKTAKSFGKIGNDWQLVDSNADYNGDGKADLLWRNTGTGEVVLWEMDGVNGKTAKSFGKVSTAWQLVDSDSDFNGDGKSDLLWRNSSTGEVVLWEMDGVNGKTAKSFGKVSTAWQIVDSDADYNGDGKADLLWQHASSGEVLLWQMDGTNGKTAVSLGTMAGDWDMVVDM